MAIKQNSGSQAPDGSMYVTMVDGAGNLSGSGAIPAGATIVSSSSGNVAAGTATATLAGAVGKTTYIAGWVFTGGGATAASIVNLTVTGTLGGTQTFSVPVPAGATVGCQPLDQNYSPAIPATATNTPIVVSVPTLGAGNTNAAVTAWGFQI